MGEWVDGWMDGWMHMQMDGWMDAWVDGWKGGWINTMGSIHTVDSDSAVKRREALIQADTWMDFEPTMLRERSQIRKDTQGGIPWTGNMQKRQVHRRRM